jgi:hypothetical protein
MGLSDFLMSPLQGSVVFLPVTQGKPWAISYRPVGAGDVIFLIHPYFGH